MKKLLVALVFVFCVSSRTLSHQLDGYTFDSYLAEFGKSYNSVELPLRKEIFERNLAKILAHNANQNSSYKMGVNQFTDQTTEEKSKLYGYNLSLASVQKATSNAPTFQATGIEVPQNFDWRDHKPRVLTPVKNQGHCGSCWAFASTSTLEAHWAIATGHLEEFSEQQVTSCAENPHHCGGTGGCHGATAQIAFQSVIDAGGITSEWIYPYTSFQGDASECKFDKTATPPVAKFSGYVNIEENSYQALIEALITQGPISVSVAATAMHGYESGVFNGCDTVNPDINHAVQLVGYGSDPVYGDYWTIRNSWGANWGEQGHIRISRTPSGQFCGIDKTPQHGSGCDGGPQEVKVCGMCGILYDNTYPIVARKVVAENQ